MCNTRCHELSVESSDHACAVMCYSNSQSKLLRRAEKRLREAKHERSFRWERIATIEHELKELNERDVFMG